jgi:hypothetical protein
MLRSQALVAVSLCCAMPCAALGSEWHDGYSVTYSGGSLQDVKGGEGLKLHLEPDKVHLYRKTHQLLLIPARAITEISYGEEVHHRIGTGAAVALVSFGIGVMVAFSKSKKHYIGITWADGDKRGGIVLQADKNEYRGLIAGLEGVSGRTAVDADSPRPSTEVSARPGSATVPATLTPDTKTSKGIVVRFTSAPTGAEVKIDGEYWGTTPTVELTMVPAGLHVIVVKKTGYETWDQKITLAPGDDRTISVELQAQPNDGTKPRIVGIN